jgi:hypothetical protein
MSMQEIGQGFPRCTLEAHSHISLHVIVNFCVLSIRNEQKMSKARRGAHCTTFLSSRTNNFNGNNIILAAS